MGTAGAAGDRAVDVLAAMAAEAMNWAAEAFTTLLRLPVQPGAIRVARLPAASVARVLREAPGVEAALYFSVTGDPEGVLLVFFPPGGTRRLTAHLTGGGSAREKPDGDREGSALREAGNILASAYLSAAGRRVGSPFKPSIPYLASNWKRAMADGALHGLLPEAGTVLLAEAPFGDGRMVEGQIVWLPGRRTRENLLPRDHRDQAGGPLGGRTITIGEGETRGGG